MFKQIITTVTFVFLVLSANAQRWKLMRWELQGGLGFTNVMGDIGGAADKNNMYGLKDIHIVGTGPGLYLGASYKFDQDMNVKFACAIGTASGSDAGSINYTRNYTYSLKYVEPTLQYEYYLLKDTRRGNGALFDSRGMVTEFSQFSVYAFVGVGASIGFPTLNTPSGLSTSFEETTVKMAFTPVVPIGFGLKWAFTSQYFLGMDFGRRIIFSDYFDGLTTNVSKSWDLYYSGNVFLIYKMKNNRSGRPKLLWRNF
jgi:hypothetical protein